LLIPVSAPSALTRSSTFRVETVQVSLHHHREQRLVDPPTPLQQGREERPCPQLRDPQLQIPRGGGQQPGPAPVALRGPLVGALPGPSADHTGQLGVDQRLVDRLRRGPDPVLNTRSLHRFQQLQ
jgi:hypothetical protein